MAFSNVNDLNENTKSYYIIREFFCYYVIPYQKRMLVLVHAGLNTYTIPLDWNSPCRGEGASHQEVSNRVRQWEELNWELQLKSSDQQIFLRMSGTDSSLIRQD